MENSSKKSQQDVFCVGDVQNGMGMEGEGEIGGRVLPVRCISATARRIRLLLRRTVQPLDALSPSVRPATAEQQSPAPDRQEPIGNYE